MQVDGGSLFNHAQTYGIVARAELAYRERLNVMRTWPLRVVNCGGRR